MASFDKVTKICAGPKVQQPTEVFRRRIFDNILKSPDKLFQISDDEGIELTYGELKSCSIRVALNLRALGVGEGDVISVLLNNSSYVCPIVIGIILNGSIFNPLTHCIKFDTNWFGMHLSAVQPKLVIMEQFAENYQDMLSLVEELKINCRIFLLNHHDKNLRNAEELMAKLRDDEEEYFIENILKSPKIDNNSLIALIPSSGTTGVAKLIEMNGLHSHRISTIWRFPEHVVGFSYSTISWLTGIAMLIYPILHNGRRIVTKSNFTLEGFVSLVKKYGITHTFVSTATARIMLKTPENVHPEYFDTVVDCLCGGERLSKNVREFMRSIFRGFSFNIAYGSSEIGVVTELGPYDTSQFIDNIVGHPKANIEVKIADISTGVVKDVKECGEILVRNGDFAGYYGDIEKTRQALSDDGEWYRTSDVGYFDEMGRLFVLGRKNQMLKVADNKEMIHSSIVENIFENFDGISSTCAVNLSDNSIAILCETSLNCEKSAEDFKQLADEALDNLKFKFNYIVFIVKNIPRTNANSIKINRASAEKLAQKLADEN